LLGPPHPETIEWVVSRRHALACCSLTGVAGAGAVIADAGGGAGRGGPVAPSTTAAAHGAPKNGR